MISPKPSSASTTVSPEVTVPELNKRPGIHYAITRDGVELPVIDITHPAFSIAVSDEQQRAMVDAFLHEPVPFAEVPKPLREPLLRFFLRGSILAEGISRAQGSFMSGMHTYLMKLGPEMLGSYAKPVDKRIAAALPAVSMRLRLQDVAQLAADFLLPLLSANSGPPLHLLNIAGGPAIDSLNALLVIRKAEPDLLKSREVSIDVLDLDEDGPAFGKAALDALIGDVGPLNGLNIRWRHVVYNWAETRPLTEVVKEAQRANAIVICTSEGGLFEYGSDEEITANLIALRDGCQAVVGSVTRNDKTIAKLKQASSAATRPRGLNLFRELASKGGWNVEHAVERPLSDQVVLSPIRSTKKGEAAASPFLPKPITTCLRPQGCFPP